VGHAQVVEPLLSEREALRTKNNVSFVQRRCAAGVRTRGLVHARHVLYR
jgi:hypothetical protein